MQRVREVDHPIQVADEEQADGGVQLDVQSAYVFDAVQVELRARAQLVRHHREDGVEDELQGEARQDDVAAQLLGRRVLGGQQRARRALDHEAQHVAGHEHARDWGMARASARVLRASGRGNTSTSAQNTSSAPYLGFSQPIVRPEPSISWPVML